MIKLLIGGSPCTHWSIAQSKNRETKAEGLGWELFKNFVIAKEKFQPDFFLYENNWSASKEIKGQIQVELGCELMRINSNLVSAQNRDRFYVFNWEVEQPDDRGILLKDILETGEPWQDKSYALTTRCNGAIPSDTLKRHRHTMIAEPINLSKDGKAHCIRATCYKDGIRNLVGNNIDKRTAVAIRVGSFPTKEEKLNNGQAQRIYSTDGKSVSLKANSGGQGGKTGLYAIRTEKPIYIVQNGIITINDKQYPIKLPDGYYNIRKLTPVECERLQTLPDNYTNYVSNTQRYIGLGNGWTAEVIIHILNGALKDVPKNEKIVVLSMYDGIGTGRYCLEKMGFTNVEYHAYEIDKYAMKISMGNYPDIIQHGDAFQLRDTNWRLEVE